MGLHLELLLPFELWHKCNRSMKPKNLRNSSLVCPDAYGTLLWKVVLIWSVPARWHWIIQPEWHLTPGWQMAFWTPFFPFGLKWKSLLRRHVMISVTTFSPEIETISSSLTAIIYIFDIFYHFFTFEPRICEVWKGKNLCPLGVKPVPVWLLVCSKIYSQKAKKNNVISKNRPA